ncbi:hypothetical protein RclHR1_01820002 [Rhizophagus clarus]|uniref:Uncharacterized protein n=1 Tax=Rhizophagus clarus TaxID=94130 RepID=A0A2Z6QLI3_9GLOM|nr:hypothetical protein RclHR1_01820002 [Rhizophagus clarus]
MVLAKDYRRNTHLFNSICSLVSCSSRIEKGSLVCQQRQAQSKVHRVSLLRETQFLSAHSVLHLWYWLKTIEEIPTFSTVFAPWFPVTRIWSIFIIVTLRKAFQFQRKASTH